MKWLICKLYTNDILYDSMYYVSINIINVYD
jgi:hypothetical protein